VRAVAVPTVEEVRALFSALDRPLVLFDGPAGTQAPDSVIEAVADYLRLANANLGGKFETSQRTGSIVTIARQAAAELLGSSTGEVTFGPNMTTLNFALTRAAAREWGADDEIVVTRLDHDANISPWLELAHDLDLVVRFCEIDDECRLDLDHLRSLLSDRTRVVAFPWASNAVGTITPVAEIVTIAHEAGALAWVDAVHYAPHGPIDVEAAGADVLLCSPYKLYGPHLGLAFGRRSVTREWRPYKVRPESSHPVGHRFETGTLQHEQLAGFIACVDYLRALGWDWIERHERELGERFLAGLPDRWTLHGPPTMDRRTPTFAITHETLTPEDAATRLGKRGFAVWHGDYFAVEVMERLGLPDGAVRIGIVHYNTADEVDRLLEALAEL
jgi:cysteine desulfurase family protein (TIGR01976 family)